MKGIFVILIFIVGCSRPDAPQNSLFNVAVFPSSGFDTYYGIGIDEDGGLVSGEIELREGEEVTVKYHWNDFVDINHQFSEEIVSRIASNLKKSFHLCKSEKIFKKPLREGESVFGDASPVYNKVNIAFSPKRTHAFVKSSLGPYFLLNLKTFEFEDFCVGNGEDVAWSSDTLIAIGYLDSAVKDIQGIRAASNTILIYDIMEGGKQYLRYEGQDIEDIKWLGNADILAVSLSEITEHSNPFVFILAAVGHPVEYRNFSVEVFNHRNNTRLKKILEENVGNAFS